MSGWLWALGGLAAMLGIGFGAYKLVSWPSLANLAVLIFNAIAPKILARKPPKEEAKDRKAASHNETRPTKQRPHPGER